MNISIRAKIFSITVILLMFIFITSIGINIERFRLIYTEVFLEKARTDAHDLANVLVKQLSKLPLARLSGMQTLLNDYLSAEHSYCYIADKDKNILYQSEGFDKIEGLDRYIFNKVKFDASSKSAILSAGRYFELVMPLVYDFEAVGTLNVGVSKKKVDEIVGGILFQNAMILFGTLIISLITLYLFVHYNISHPIARLRYKISNLSSIFNLSGDYGDRPGDELSHFAGTFERMTEELRQKTVTKDFIQNVFESIPDAVFVANMSGTIKMANKAAGKMLAMATEQITEALIWQFFDDEKTFGVSNEVLMSNVKKGFFRDIRTFIRNREGKNIPVTLDCSVVEGKYHEALSIVCMVREIALERRQIC
ncbi:MAG: PAS domain S-box protein [Candidatus Omnitrophica bacterium]|nr:PAS domain S-box protein [Candidatus Omnitrophota bacterium]